ncbi:hypothetical protein [Hymenobacter rigui]|uniref:Uncharacterized protein n=1 Tax=Hymenobacter rigui TaxID=334424 RepID=A0A3R9V7T2_9BACT|nr:hypothetical protein [Hymenobacter rigui]RSK48513.1 hypothetical protein EI291_12410 [Hymenobacter rigui]
MLLDNNNRYNSYALLLSVITALLLFGCESKSNEQFTVKRDYSYTIRASISGNIFSGDGPTYLELRPKHRRRMKFYRLPEKPDAIMYAYRLTSKSEYDEKLNKSVVVSGDTIEVAVTAPQADSLFNLAKDVFESVSVSNIDTIYTDPKMTTFWTDDASGIMSIDSKYGNIQIDAGALHRSDNRQAASFIALWEGFDGLFSRVKK